MYAAISALSEPMGALFGWLILATTMKDEAYGVLFGESLCSFTSLAATCAYDHLPFSHETIVNVTAIVGGMMVTISVQELIPSACRCVPKGMTVTYSFVFGMMFMSISLVLLQF